MQQIFAFDIENQSPGGSGVHPQGLASLRAFHQRVEQVQSKRSLGGHAGNARDGNMATARAVQKLEVYFDRHAGLIQGHGHALAHLVFVEGFPPEFAGRFEDFGAGLGRNVEFRHVTQHTHVSITHSLAGHGVLLGDTGGVAEKRGAFQTRIDLGHQSVGAVQTAVGQLLLCHQQIV